MKRLFKTAALVLINAYSFTAEPPKIVPTCLDTTQSSAPLPPVTPPASLDKELAEKAVVNLLESLTKYNEKRHRNYSLNALVATCNPRLQTVEYNTEHMRAQATQALFTAARLGDAYLIDRLLATNLGLDVNTQTLAHRLTPIMIAAERGHEDAVFALSDSDEKLEYLITKDIEGKKAIDYAKKSGNKNIIMLLEGGDASFDVWGELADRRDKRISLLNGTPITEISSPTQAKASSLTAGTRFKIIKARQVEKRAE